MPFFILFFFLITLFSCNSTNNKPQVENPLDSLISTPLQYANNFNIQKQKDYTLLTIKSAWKGSSENFQYLLYPKGQTPPTDYPNAIKISVPVERIICTSTVDIAFLDCLGATDKIVAISNGQYIYNPIVKQKLKEGKIIEIGGNNSIDYELALTTQADIAMVYSIGDLQAYKKFSELGIPAILLSDFMETTPLGRAEWLLFVACLLGKENEAISKFNTIAQEYENSKKEAKEQAYKPTVLTGAVYNGTWYVAGGKSLMASFIEDAGGQYLWANNQEVSGVPMDFEAVYAQALNVDYWINISNFTNKKDLGNSETKYQDFKAFQQNQLYNYYKRSTLNGGSDIFESAIVNPHLVLKDMMNIFHNKYLDTNTLYYYAPLK